jgi:hypothetical protein
VWGQGWKGMGTSMGGDVAEELGRYAVKRAWPLGYYWGFSEEGAKKTGRQRTWTRCTQYLTRCTHRRVRSQEHNAQVDSRAGACGFISERES